MQGTGRETKGVQEGWLMGCCAQEGAAAAEGGAAKGHGAGGAPAAQQAAAPEEAKAAPRRRGRPAAVPAPAPAEVQVGPSLCKLIQPKHMVGWHELLGWLCWRMTGTEVCIA